MGAEQYQTPLASDSTSSSMASFGDVLHDVLVRTIEEDPSPGLLTLPFPTGTGKSYAVIKAMATLISRMPPDSPPIIFATSQKKNIPNVDNILARCDECGYRPGPHDVIRLFSSSDMLAQTASTELLERIPREHREKTNVEELIETVCAMRGGKGYESALRILLPDFKRSIRKILPGDCWEERISLLESCNDWQWLADLWPAVFTRRAKILLMTSSKLFLPHDTLLEAPCPLDEAEWIHGSVVFMDEFDSAKQDCLRAIASDSTHIRADLAGLVGSLRHGVDTSRLPESILAGTDSKQASERLERLRAKLDETAMETCLDYVYKADEDAIGSEGLFMYDGTRQGTSIGAPFRVRTDASRRENVIIGKCGASEGTRALAADVGSLRGAVSYTQYVIASMVRDRHGWGLTGIDEETMRNEILSILDAFGLKGEGERTLMLNGVRRILMGGRYGHRSLIKGPTVYEQSFGLVVIEDSEDHKYATRLYAYSMDDTPEVRLRDLVEGSLVVGLSATATIDSPLCNFDLQWLEEQRPDLMRRLGDSDAELLASAFDRHVAGYDKVDIRVVPVHMPCSRDSVLYDTASSVVNSEILRDRVANILNEVDAVEDSGQRGLYRARRYARVAWAYRYFLENIKEGVFVCATSAAPKSGHDASASLRVETLKDLFSLVRRDLRIPEDNGAAEFIEGSTDFQQGYDRLVSKLGKGCPRMFVCAAYGSLATGVNLQYDGKGMQTVSVGVLSQDSYVDLVGVYLDCVTGVAPTTNRVSDTDRGLDTLMCAYELREMNWRGDISVQEMDSAVRALVRNLPTRGLSLVDKHCVKAACTRTVVQMVGRMCRTSNKAPVIHVLFDEGLVDRIDPYALDDELVGKETEALLSKIASMSTHETITEGIVENRLASRGMATAARLASLVRSDAWAKRDIQQWEEMRIFSLTHPCPTPDVLEGSGMECYYVGVHRGANSYRYCEWGDFKNVDVTFDMDDEDFPLEVSERAARLELIASMPETRNLFERKGWPLRWEASGLMMNPALFRNIYLGAIGEQVGKAILEARIPGLLLEPIEDPKKFEKFDFVVSGTDIYVDFKNWHAPSAGGGADIAWLREKMGRVEATYALIVNIFSSDSLRNKRYEEIGSDILLIPYLIDDESRCVATHPIIKVQSWLRKAGFTR